ncbi:acetyltransferase [Erysipelotrichaceae bacterium RD49]|nr:acetyltransferase [Erysipelotrichaceae bacterium RD49]
MGNKYTPSEYIKNIYSLLMTKITMKQARFIRRPIYIRGRSSLSGCIGLTTGRFCRFDLQGNELTLFIGNNCEIGDMTHIVAHEKVKIGNNVLIASKCFISDTNHGLYKGDVQDSPLIPPNQRKLVTAPVVIGNNVWIGENVVILAGTDIGDGCIIGANSVVSGKYEKNSIIAGVPGKIIKSFDENVGLWKKSVNNNGNEIKIK